MKIARSARLMLLGILFIPGVLYAQTTPWQVIGPEGGPIAAMAQDPSNPSNLLVASMGYPAQIFRSADHGQSWSCYSTVYGSVSKLLFDLVDPTIVYALLGYGLSRTRTGDDTWSGINFPSNHYARDFILDPADHTIIHVIGYIYDQSSGSYQMGYWRRVITGSTWTDLTPATASGYAYAIEIESGNTRISI